MVMVLIKSVHTSVTVCNIQKFSGEHDVQHFAFSVLDELQQWH